MELVVGRVRLCEVVGLLPCRRIAIALAHRGLGAVFGVATVAFETMVPVEWHVSEYVVSI